MTVHEFLQTFVDEIGSVDLKDTDILIRTPDGDYEPYTFDWEPEGDYNNDTLLIDVLGVDDGG